MYNPVKFVSLGPGEAELITLKGLKTLQQADKIFTPSTIAPTGKLSSRSKDILLELGIDESKISLFDVPMNKDRSLAIISYKQVAEQIEIDVKKGYKTVVVAEGDAGFYSSTHYISDNLMSKDLSTEKIAGVPAFIASGALANIHIAKLEEELNVIPGVISSDCLIKKIKEGKNVVIMKPSQSEEAIKQAVNSMRDANVHYFENTGVKGKEFYTQDAEEIANRKFPYFSLLIITKK